MAAMSCGFNANSKSLGNLGSGIFGKTIRDLLRANSSRGCSVCHDLQNGFSNIVVVLPYTQQLVAGKCFKDG